MYPILFEIGPVRIYSFGIIALSAFILCYFLAHRQFQKNNIEISVLNTLFAIISVSGFLGARALFLLENSGSVANLAQLIRLNSGLTWYGGFLLAGAMTFAYLKWQRLEITHIAGILVPLVLLGYAIGRIGCQLAGDGDYGPATTVPWAMAYPDGIVPTNILVHPTPVYDTLIAGVFFILLWHKRQRLADGQITWLAFIALGVTRFITEFFRNTPRIFWGYLSMAQMISFLLIAVSILGLSFMIKNDSA